MPLPTGNEPGQDYPNRRGPRTPVPGGDGPTVPSGPVGTAGVPGQTDANAPNATNPLPTTPTQWTGSQVGGSNPWQVQIPGAADTTPYSPVSADQQAALGQADPNFLLNFNYQQGQQAQPGQANPAFAQLNASMGTPFEGQDTGFAPRVYNQTTYGQPRPQDGPGARTYTPNPAPNPNPGQPQPNPLGTPAPVTAPNDYDFPTLNRRMGYGSGGGYGR